MILNGRLSERQLRAKTIYMKGGAKRPKKPRVSLKILTINKYKCLHEIVTYPNLKHPALFIAFYLSEKIVH